MLRYSFDSKLTVIYKYSNYLTVYHHNTITVKTFQNI